MRRWSVVLLLAAVATPAARAQSASQPNLVFTVSGGLITGGALWHLDRQLELAPGINNRDTLSLSRRLRPGLAAVVSATYFRSPNLGYTMEIGYFGVASESRCAPVGPYTSDSENKNEQACNATQGAHYPTSLVGFQGGLLYRFLSRGPVAPYVRASGGLGVLGNSLVETYATIVAPAACSAQGVSTCVLGLLNVERRVAATWVGTLAIGTSLRIGQGYQLRFEMADFIARLPIAADSSTPSASEPIPKAKIGMRTRHLPTITAGLEIVLERSHRRRY